MLSQSEEDRRSAVPLGVDRSIFQLRLLVRYSELSSLLPTNYSGGHDSGSRLDSGRYEICLQEMASIVAYEVAEICHSV